MEALGAEAIRRLAANLDCVLGRIARAAERSGRPASAVRLVAVTKSVGPEVAAALLRLGQFDLGENRPEAVPLKHAALGDERSGVRWHLIGHYQSRKVRATLPLFHLVHSVHDSELAVRVDRVGAESSRATPLLLQVNVSGEASKQGFTPAETAEFLRDAGRFHHLDVRGLMTIAREGDDDASLHATFARLRTLRDSCATGARPLPELSMGMSQDFEAAILEGATFVRIGSALFEGVLSPP